MASKISKIKSAASKVKSAATSYAKNVKGGAGIVSSALSGAVKDIAKKAGGQGASPVMVFKVGEGLTPTQTATANKTLGIGAKPSAPQIGSTGVQQGPQLPPKQGPQLPAGFYPQSNKKTSSSGEGNILGASTSSFGDTNSTALRAGQFGGSTSFSGSSLGSTTPNLPSTNVINTPTLGTQNTKLTFDEPVPEDYSSKIPPLIESPLTKAEDDTKTALEDYLDTLDGAPNSAKAYEKAQRETGILEKQKVVNDLTGQLNAIVNKGQANQLSLIGQGRGIPEAIIGGQQAQIGRETAIAALPIQAQLSAAQGNLEMANDNLDTLFKIYSDDARNEFEARREQKKMVYEIASAKEKRELDKLDKLEERAYQETQDLNDERSMYAKMAFANGQSTLGSKIAKLDYRSPTFRNDLATLSSQIVDSERNLRIEKLQKDLADTGTNINPKILNTTQFKAAQAAQNLKLTLEKTKAAVEKYGNYEKASGVGKGILDTLKVQLRSEISTALEQGVVVPGEAESFDKIAGSLNSTYFGIPNVRNSTTLGAIDSLLGSMEGRINLQKAAITNTYKVTDEQLDTLLNITDLSDQEFADMDAIID